MKLRLRLYVAGQAPNSVAARRNLAAALGPDGKAEVETIDVLDAPERALADGVLVTPTLLRVRPAPVVFVVGTLADRAAVRAALGLEEDA